MDQSVKAAPSGMRAVLTTVLFALLVSGTAAGKGETCYAGVCRKNATASDWTQLCCPSKWVVKHHQVGLGKWSAFTIDNFLCPDILEMYDKEFLPVANDYMADNNLEDENAIGGAYAGSIAYINRIPHTPATNTPFLQKAPLTHLVKSGSGLQQSLDQIGKGEMVVCLFNGLKEWGFDSDFNAAEFRKKHDTRFARSYGDLHQQAPNDVHYDDVDWVVNLHMSPYFNDTATALWNFKKPFLDDILKEIKVKNPSNFSQLKKKTVGYCRGKTMKKICDEGVKLSGDLSGRKNLKRYWQKERTGMYDKYYQVPFRHNRMTLCDGWLLHSPIFKPAALKRAKQKPRTIENSRFMFQTFCNMTRIYKGVTVSSGAEIGYKGAGKISKVEL